MQNAKYEEVAYWRKANSIHGYIVSKVVPKDIRDEKEYYVTRLEGGNVWMTQNLDLDIDETKTYKEDFISAMYRQMTHEKDTKFKFKVVKHGVKFYQDKDFYAVSHGRVNIMKPKLKLNK